MSAYLLLIITCYTATKAARDSLFIIEIGPAQLPILYMLTAAAMAVISLVYPLALRRIGLYSLVGVTSLASVASLVLFWWIVDNDSHTALYVLYIWVSIFGAITASQAWSLASHVFDAREARRSYAWIGLGGVVGGIAGGSLARFVAPWLGTETLLPISAGLMGLTVIILLLLASREGREEAEQPQQQPDKGQNSGSTVFSRVRESPYLSTMVGLLFVGVIIEAFVDYEFKTIARQSFDSKDGLTSFLGTIASYGGILALFVQTLATGPLLKRFGVGAAILLFPSALLVSFLIVAAHPALWGVSILKLVDGCLSYSVHRSGMELLFVPIPAKLRAAVKALIDLLVDRVGRALGGILLLALTVGLSFSVQALSLVAVCGLVLWIGMAIAIRSKYVDAFRVALERKVIEPESLEVSSLDSTISRSLLQALSSEDDRQVLYALNLLASGPPVRWRQYLPALINHKTAAVRSRTIAVLTEWRDFSRFYAEPKLLDPDLDVRVEAVRHLCEAEHPQTRTKLTEFLSHPDYRVVLAAIHCIARYRLKDGDLIDEPLIEKALTTSGEHSVSAKTAAARALAITRLPRATEFLDRLMKEPDLAVVEHAVRSSGDLRYEGAIPLLISMLAKPRLRLEAREALLKLGSPAFNELRSRFSDDRTPLDVRVRIPRALALWATQDAADFLVDGVNRFTPPINRSLLKALNRMRNEFTDLTFDRERISSLIAAESEKHQRLDAVRDAMGTNGSQDSGAGAREVLELLEKALHERHLESVETVFRLLYLIYLPADIRSVYFSFNSRPSLRASAVEFLDNLLDPNLRALVIPIVEERAAPDSPDRSKEVGNRLTTTEAVRMLLADDDEWLRTIAEELDAKWGAEGVLSSRIA
jgi:ATP/ADP translocase/HEAT repeat protein